MIRRHSLPSIRARLLTLVLAGVLPILIGVLALARDAAQRERAHLAQDAQTVARHLVAAVDREITGSETAARILADSEPLAKGMLRDFHARARQLLRPDFPAHAFALYDAGGRQLLNTRAPFGAPGPPDANEANVQRVFAAGETAVTGLRPAGPDEQQVMAILVPVWREGHVVYALSAQLRPTNIAELLDGQNLPPRWVAEVYDHDRRMVARSADPTTHLGAPMPAQLAAQLRRDDAGIAEARTAQADFIAYARSAGRRWTVAVIVPRAAAPQLLGRSTGTLLAAVAALLALALGLAWLVGGSIAGSLRALIEPAAALGRGDKAAVPEMSIREAHAVAVALRKAGGTLQRYQRRLAALAAERTAELAQSNALLEMVYSTVPAGLAFMDRDLRFVMVNDYLAALNAVPASQHIGRTPSEVLGWIGTQCERDCRRVLESGRPLVEQEASGAVPGSPGVVRHWISSYYPVFGPGREVAGINAVVHDVSERTQHEPRDHDNEDRFRQDRAARTS